MWISLPDVAPVVPSCPLLRNTHMTYGRKPTARDIDISLGQSLSTVVRQNSTRMKGVTATRNSPQTMNMWRGRVVTATAPIPVTWLVKVRR